MIQIISEIVPVVAIVLVGAVFRKKNILSPKTVSELKNLLVRYMLPVAVFDSLATGTFSSDTWVIVGLMLAVLAVSFGAGFLMRPLLQKPLRRYLPFMLTAYEGGMIAFPLYIQLCGRENLYHIAVLEIAACIFGYGIYMNILTLEEKHEKLSATGMVKNAFTNPAFVAALLGLLIGASGIFSGFFASEYAKLYHNFAQLATASLAPMILLVVGYSMDLRGSDLRPALKTIVLRAALQAALIVGVLFVLHRITAPDRLTDMAFLIYMSAPPTFSLQSFIKDSRGANYASTVSGLYIALSIVVFAIASMML